MSAVCRLNSCSDDVWKGVGGTCAVLALIVTTVAIATLAKTAGSPALLLYRHPVMITFFILDIALIIGTVISFSHLMKCGSKDPEEALRRDSAQRPDTPIPTPGHSRSPSVSQTLPQPLTPRPALRALKAKSPAQIEGASAPPISPEATLSAGVPREGSSSPPQQPVGEAHAVDHDNKVDERPKIDFENLVIVPLLNAIEGVMREWITAAFCSYYFKKDEEQNDLNERLAALKFFFGELKNLGLAFVKDPANPKNFTQSMKDIVSIFVLNLDFDGAKEKLFWNEEQIAPVFCQELITFLNRFVFIINKDAPFKKVEFSKFPKGAAQNLEKAVGWLDSNKFSIPITGMKALLSGHEKQVAINLFKAIQYPFYYSFTTDQQNTFKPGYGMPQFRKQFKEKAVPAIQALAQELEDLKEQQNLKFGAIVAVFQRHCTSFEAELKKIRTERK